MRLRRVYLLLLLALLPLPLGRAPTPATARDSGPPPGEQAFFPPRRAHTAVGDPRPSREQPSAFMAGRVAIQAILVESDGAVDPSAEDWTPDQVAAIRGQIGAALDWWRARLPNARLSFDLTTRIVESDYEPITYDLAGEDLWIGDTLRRIGFPGANYFDQAYTADDALRHARATDWATTIFVVNSEHDDDGRFADGLFAYAYIGGPFLVITSKAGPYGTAQLAPVVAHELGHIFGALDQYAAAQVPCTQASGYLSVSTINSQMDNCGTHFTSIMLDPVPAYIGGQVDASALGQIGYRDSENDGLPDPLDTAPVLQATIVRPPNAGRPVVAGWAIDQPYPSHFEPPATINAIERVEYRVDSGDWIALPAADGIYDSASESITTTLPLYDGQHGVELRAINSVGAASPLVRKSVTVNGVGAAPDYGAKTPQLSNSTKITLALVAPAGSSAQISEDPFFIGSAWVPAAANVGVRLSATDGPHNLYVRFRDGSGLESPPFSRTVTLDRQAPSGHALIHGGAAPWVEIQAEDSVSGVAAVQIDDDVSTGAWQPFQQSLPIGRNRIRIQVRLRDAAGNISKPIPIQSSGIYLPLISTL
ncbi:MAG: hypothetical protein ACJ8CR_32865 [Roseiflexaceae bacterium]